jgi:hypothetical protein
MDRVQQSFLSGIDEKQRFPVPVQLAATLAAMRATSG